MYKNKYFKYKNKYLKLKKLISGSTLQEPALSLVPEAVVSLEPEAVVSLEPEATVSLVPKETVNLEPEAVSAKGGKLYMYTLRRKQKKINETGNDHPDGTLYPFYTGLIPKLFNYRSDTVDKSTEHIGSKKYMDLLFDANSSFIKDMSEINHFNDIVQLNLKVADKSLDIKLDEDVSEQFYDHLLRSHADMAYGLYFTLIKANDDEDFKRKMKYEDFDPLDKEHKICWYIQLEEFLNIADGADMYYKNIYYNTKWDYGKFTEGSKNYNTKNKEKFITSLSKQDNDTLYNYELICRFPIDLDVFLFKYILLQYDQVDASSDEKN